MRWLYNPVGGPVEMPRSAAKKLAETEKEGVSGQDAMQRRAAVAMQAAPDRAAGEAQNVPQPMMRKATEDGQGGHGQGGGGGNLQPGFGASLSAAGSAPAQQPNQADAKSGKLRDGTLGEIAPDSTKICTRKMFLLVAAGVASNRGTAVGGDLFGKLAAGKGQAIAGTPANGLAVVEITLSPEGLRSDAIRLCLAQQHIVLEDEVALDGVTNVTQLKSNLGRSAPVAKRTEPAGAGAANALSDKNKAAGHCSAVAVVVVVEAMLSRMHPHPTRRRRRKRRRRNRSRRKGMRSKRMR